MQDQLASELDVRSGGARPKKWTTVAAFCATAVCGGVHAVSIPDIPLQASGNPPPANVLFILDDSFSMRTECMPRSCVGASPIEQRSLVHNSLSYDPVQTYRPWMKADGTRYPETGMYTAWKSNTLASSPGQIPTPEWFMPITAASEATKSMDARDYFRYQLRTIDGVWAVIRSRWALGSEGYGVGLGQKAGCPGAIPTAYTYYDCTEVSFNGRSGEEELANWLNWYSYHRTRIKVAKAAASEAFGQIGSNFRVGLDTLHRVTSTSQDEMVFEIPVGTEDGLFKGTNKAVWFDKLFEIINAADGTGTPLRSRLERAGKYFSRTDGAGPWGPQQDNQISCRQNFTVLATDGYWNSDFAWDNGTAGVGDADGTGGPLQQSVNGEQYNYQPSLPYYDNFVETGVPTRPNTLADAAMHFWKTDLRPDLANNVPVSPGNPAFWQHMVTFGISIGLKGRLDYTSDLTALAAGTKHWGDPTVTPFPDDTDKGDADHIDDLWHASVNSRGSFAVARNASELTKSLLEGFDSIAAQLGSGGNVTANSTSLTADTHLYQATFLSRRWSGELAAYPVSPLGVQTTPLWKASDMLRQAARKILTWNGSSGAEFPTDAQIGLLDARSRAGAPVSGADNAAYIKGDRSKERQNGGQLRDRSSILGDIVNSSPVYMKELGTIFVGANDGMLHAFDAATGSERFAYLPASIDFAALTSLSDPAYTHKYFVDGPIGVTTLAQGGGRHILVGGLGRGGRGVFALDVTAPDAMGDGSVLWELTAELELGNVLGEPLFATLNDQARTKVVMFGNGVNSPIGQAVLYVVDQQTGEVLNRIETGGGVDNGLFAPRGWDNDGNGTVDFVYAGDMMGRLWKFDFHTEDRATGVLDLGGQPLFKTANGQPITSGLALAREPTAQGRRWVFFGTGSLMTTSDLTDTAVQAMYGLIDGGAPIDPLDLQERQITSVTTQQGKLLRSFDSAESLPTGKKGWHLDLDLPQKGERIVSRPQIRGNVLLFPSVIPPTDNQCEPGGRGFVNAIDAFTGAGVSSPYFDSNGDGRVDDEDRTSVAGTLLPVGSIDVGVGMPSLPTLIDEVLTVGGSTGKRGQIRVRPPGGKPRRVAWREIRGV